MKRELRKTEDKLVIDGLGVIIFAVWHVFRSFLVMWMDGDRIETETAEIADLVSQWVFILVLLFFMILIVTPRLYIGFSAIAEGKGKGKRRGYLVAAGLIAALDICLFTALAVFLIYQMRAEGSVQLSGNGILALVIDATSLWILIEMIVSARKVRRLRNRAKE